MARILEYDLNLLTNYLIKYPYDEIKLTIDEIERIACGRLPDFMLIQAAIAFGITIITAIRHMRIIGLTQVTLLILILIILLFILPSLIINLLSERPIIKSLPLLKKLI